MSNTEDGINTQPVEGDRDIPSVASGARSRLIPTIVFGTIAVLGIGLIILDGNNNRTTPTFVAPDEEEFRINRNSPGAPAIIPRAPAPAPPPVAQETVIVEQPLTRAEEAFAARQTQIEAEALRIARAQQERLQERKHSPQLVFSGGTRDATASTGIRPPGLSANVVTPDQLRAQAARTAGNTGTAVPGLSGIGPVGSLAPSPGDPSNPNQAFANANAQQGFQTASAIQLDNLPTLVPQGTLISGVLETAIRSDLPGQVRAIVSENIWSFDQSEIMIPRGSRLIGQYRSGVVQGQTSVFVIWDRLIRPDGVSIQVASVGTDQLGRSGLDGQLDTHFLQRFGSSILLTLIDGAVQAGVAAIDNDDAAGIAINGGNSFSRAAELALENSINIPPTIHVDQGKRIKVFVGRDLDFSEV